VLFQRLLNRTERLKNRLGAILGLSWDAMPPDTLAGLAGRVSTLEGNQGGTTLSAHRTAPVLDHPDGSVTLPKLASTAFSVVPIPNTLVLRTAQGSVLSGAKDGPNTVLRVEGFYWWYDPDKWLRLARWTGVSGALKGIFADLTIHRTVNQSFGARLRVEAATDGSGVLGQPAISLALDRSPIVTNAALVQTSADTIELWALFPWGNAYVSGVVGTNVGDVQLAPPGDANSLVRDSLPTPVSGGLFLEWASAPIDKTFPGPGYIVSASRDTSSGYIRYDNGIQVCWAQHAPESFGSVMTGQDNYRYRTKYWTFPAAFAEPPAVLVSATTAIGERMSNAMIHTLWSTGCYIEVGHYSSANSVDVFYAHSFAIGRWK
jgi:hypothetical protein